MAFIGLRVPHEAARLLSQVEQAQNIGTPEPLDSYHVTMIHLGGEIPIEDIVSAIGPVFDVASETRPFTVSTSHVSTFGYNGKTVPIIAFIDSPDLHALHARLVAVLDDAGVSFSKKWKEFRPHVTLSYTTDPTVDDGIVNVHLPAPVAWGAHELVLWGGDAGDDRLIVTFPFTLGLNKESEEEPVKAKAKEAALYRGAVRLACSRMVPTATAGRVLQRFLKAQA